MNKIVLMGRLTKAPEMRQANGLDITRFSIAVDRRGKKDEADFFNCTAFGKTAEFVNRYFGKGSRMLLTGRVQNDNYTDKAGNKVYSVSVIVDDVEFADSKKTQEAAKQEPQGGDFMTVPDGFDGLPFD